VAEGERSLAIFIDFENLALGFQGRRERFDIARVLERLVEKGKVVSKKAYADWNRFSIFTHAMHEAAIELIEIPRRGQTGKNSADIRLCVDAMDLAYSKEHINTFVILSGDSDFSPLVSKLKELGKHVIGLGMQDSTSDLLRDNCDEFIYYEDLGRDPAQAPDIDAHLPEMKRKAFALLLESLLALRRENKDVLWSSMVKDTIKRKKPSFNETYHGYRTFSELLEDAQREGLLELETDKRSRTYVVTRFGSEMHAEPQAQPAPATAALGPAASGPAGMTIGGPVGPGSVGEQGPIPGGKKSRRRRRRRGGAAIAEGNGAPGQPRPAPQVPPPSVAEPISQPVRPPHPTRQPPPPPRQPSFAEGLDLPGSETAIPAPPPPREPEPARVAIQPEPEPARQRVREREPEPASKPQPQPAEEPATKPAARGRARATRGTTKTTTTRTRRTSTAGQKKEKKSAKGSEATSDAGREGASKPAEEG
jgi:uncharacterized protein (TIGR00288 family)